MGRHWLRGSLDYPELLRRLEDSVGDDSYTLNIVAQDLGIQGSVARALWLCAGVGVLAAAAIVGRRGGERTAFILAVTAALALTPIVWLHYFALLAVVVSLAQPRLSLIWFVPLGMIITPGSGHPTPFETSWTLGIAALTIGLALRSADRVVAAHMEVSHA